MKDVMLDLETFGTRPGSVIRSIGAVFFDAHNMGQEFYVNVDQASCEKFGLTTDPGTVAWWERQSEAAKAALLIDPVPLDVACWNFSTWWSRSGGSCVWSHGANLDGPLMEAAYEKVGMRPPWQFWNTRCTRTLFAIAGIDTAKAKRSGEHHHALDDCKTQIAWAQAAYRRIHIGPAVDQPAPTPNPNTESVFA